ncbi:MAG: hypothetical protein WCF78_00620 [archaeon]
MKFVNILVLIIILVLISLFIYPSFNKNKDVIINLDPYQKNLDASDSFKTGAYTITKVAEYDITARVLSTKKYNDKMSELSKFDFALGWNKMSDYNIVKETYVTQYNRFFLWHLESNYQLITVKEVTESGANVHMLTDNKSVQRQLRKVNKNDIVNIKGYLVNVQSDSGWLINSSLTRTDDGPGACEVLWVEKITILN